MLNPFAKPTVQPSSVKEILSALHETTGQLDDLSVCLKAESVEHEAEIVRLRQAADEKQQEAERADSVAQKFRDLLS